jgi:hypothetical protein
MLRDTKARFRKRVRFLGVEGGVLPLAISGGVSAALALGASQLHGKVWMALALAPFVLTFIYMLVFITGRRPHFARDIAAICLSPRTFRALSPASPGSQPRHPTLPKLARGVRHAQEN